MNKIKFITLRKRSKKLIQEIYRIPKNKWKKIYVAIPKRKHKKVSVYENEVVLSGCKNTFRQIIIKDHGRINPTIIITNTLHQMIGATKEKKHLSCSVENAGNVGVI